MDDIRFQQLRDAVTHSVAARREAVAEPVHTLHRWILRHFAGTGQPPSPQTMRDWADDLGIVAEDALAELIRVDLLQGDPAAAKVYGAYPLLVRNRGHRVEIAGGPAVNAYCAGDALGVPAMLGRDATIISRDPHTGGEVRVEVRGGQASWQPAEAVFSMPTVEAIIGDHTEQFGDTLCPIVNLYVDAEAARAYIAAHRVHLEILTMPQAIDIAEVTFGDLLNPQASQASTYPSARGVSR